MTHKSCLETKDSETLIGSRVGKGYDCLCHLFLDFKEALTILTGKNCVLLSSVQEWLLGYF